MTDRQWKPPRLINLTYRPVVSLTERQADVLTGLCMGLTATAIGRRLGVKEQTVKTHLRHLYRALNADDRAHAAALTASGQVVVIVRDRSAA